MERYAKTGKFEEFCNSKIQDLMHELELDDDLTYHDQAKIARKIKEVREERREIKDFRIESEALVAWAKRFPSAVKELRDAINATCTSNRKMSVREYAQRTSVIEEVFGKGCLDVDNEEN